MKLFDIDWQDFFAVLPLWNKAAFGRRRIFLDKSREKQSLDTVRWGHELATILGKKGPLGSEDDEYRPYRSFYRVIRAMDRNRLFEAPDLPKLQRYLVEHFTLEELESIKKGGNFRSSQYQEILRYFTSGDRLEQFLNQKGLSWEQDYIDSYSKPYFFSQDTQKNTQKILRYVMESSSPVPFNSLAGIFPGIPLGQLSNSIKAGIRYILFFPAIRSDDLEPVLWIWPPTAGRLQRQQAKPPAPVKVSSVFHSAFLMEDMVTILVICANEPLRCKGNDDTLFARAERQIAENLMSIPEYVEECFGITAANRIDMALSYLESMGYVKKKGTRGEDFRIESTHEGIKWLALSVKDRLKALFDYFKDFSAKRSYAYFNYLDGENRFLPYVSSSLLWRIKDVLPQAVISVFSALRDQEFINIVEFLEYHKVKSNPLFKLLKKNNPGFGMAESLEEMMEKDWEELLSRFIIFRLFQLGGAKIGISEKNLLSFMLTDAGRYYLGLINDFDYGVVHEEKVIVQPNFEIVFLAPAPIVEANIGRFAERKGKNIGALFKITKKSIFSAASTGLTAKDVLDTLNQVSAKEIPANVKAEIKSWFSQCRQIAIRSALLVHCPDAETAASVVSIGGENVIQITETVLEITAGKERTALIKKLKTMGIFVKLSH